MLKKQHFVPKFFLNQKSTTLNTSFKMIIYDILMKIYHFSTKLVFKKINKTLEC